MTDQETQVMTEYPPIPEKTELFQHGYGYQKPTIVHKWQWSTTFGRWSALVTFADGWHGYTYPKLNVAPVGYTLDQIKELENAPDSMVWSGAYDRAITDIIVWADGYTQAGEEMGADLAMVIHNNSIFNNVVVKEWGDNPLTCEFTASLNVANFMAAKHICNKYRALFYVVKNIAMATDYNDLDIDTRKMGEQIHPLQKWSHHVIYRGTDIYDEDRPRWIKLMAQCKEVGELIEAYIYAASTVGTSHIQAQGMYFSSDEYANEQAAMFGFLFNNMGEMIN